MAIGSPSAKYTTPRKAAPKVENTPKRRRFSNKDKIHINQLYAQWVQRGKVDEESPIEAIVTEFGCDRTYPSRLFARAAARGSVFPKTPSGRPPVYGKEHDDFIILIIAEYRAKRRIATAEAIHARFVKSKKFNPVPCVRWIRGRKSALGFVVISVKVKPMLSKDACAKRLAEATWWLSKPDSFWARRFGMDESVFRTDSSSPRYEARPCDEVPSEVAFMGQKAETRTQAEKVHIITCVGAAGKAFMKELDWSRHFDADGYKTKGYGAVFMKPFWGQMQKAAAKKLKEKGIKGKPFLDLDRAPVHNALVTRAELDRTWGEGNWRLQSPSSPDFNENDVFVYPNMKRNVYAKGATTKDELRSAIKEVWSSLDDETCARGVERLKRNLMHVRDLEGGNFYDESWDFED